MKVKTSRPITEPERRLLAFLVKRTKTDSARISEAERYAITEGISAFEALEKTGVISQDALASELASALRLPLLNLTTVPFDDEATRLVDQQTATRREVVPLRVERDVLVIAMANPFDQEAIRDIEFATGRRVRPALAARSAVLEAIDHCYKVGSAMGEILSALPDNSQIAVVDDGKHGASDDHAVESLAREAERAPIIKMVNLVLVEALAARASDVHIEPGTNLVRVRYRIDGMLEDALQLPKWVQNPVVARLKVMAGLDITERRVPQDGRIKLRIKDHVVDLRVSSLPTSDGEKIVMRVLDSSSALRKLDAIGLGDRDLAMLRAAIQKPEGMILVTGPTGSGKTTTLYAVIQEIIGPEINIVTIENPIEYHMKGVAQVQVNEKQGLTFAEALRSILRQDPDVILVGEIRDRETAEIAFHAAQTGHLVLSTVHTNDTTSTVTRLLDLGVERPVISSSLMAVISQRLVRTVCTACGRSAPVDPAAAKTLGLPPGSEEMRGAGCTACRKTGYTGRTGVYEVLAITQRMQEMIEAQAPETALRRTARDEGMTTLVDAALDKIRSGKSSAEEVLRAVQVETQGPRCPQCSSPIEEKFTTCPFCLHQLQRTCTACGVTLKREWKSCPYCGTIPAAGQAVEPAVPAPQPPPSPPRVEPPAAVQPPPSVPKAPPAAGAAAPASTPAAAAPASDSGSIEQPKILVVDDNESLRKLVRLTLQRGIRGALVDEAESGPAALAKVAVSRPHLILLDLMMPEMDGFEVCRRLRADLQTAFIPLVMLTAREDSASKEQGFLAGTDDYIVKPFQAAELVARVRRLLDRTYGARGAAS